LAMDLAGHDEHTLGLWGWIALCGAYPVARLIGQLGVAAPGGLGVREGAYVVLVLPLVGGPVGAAIAAWARLCSIVSELLIYAGATLWARRESNSSITRIQ
jgi:glycosyltransferase 2 family protein